MTSFKKITDNKVEIINETKENGFKLKTTISNQTDNPPKKTDFSINNIYGYCGRGDQIFYD